MVKLHKLISENDRLFKLEEILEMLSQNKELFQKGLERGKVIKRGEIKTDI